MEWIGRIGLAAALLLLAVPTAGRFVQATGHPHHAALAAATAGPDAHGPHRAAEAASGERADARIPPSPSDDAGPDCDYCPLLASLLVGFQAPPPVQAAAGASEDRPTPAAPLRAWLHPNGLGSRGPPAGA